MRPLDPAPLGVRLSRRWVRRYTRDLPGDSGTRRVAEIESDVHDQLAHAHSYGHRHVGASILWRSLRGIPADISWRRQERSMIIHPHPHPSPGATAWAMVRQGWFAPIAALVGLFDIALAIGVATESDGKMPGQAIGPVVLAFLAIGLFAGLWLRVRIARAASVTTPLRPDPRPMRSRGAVATLVIVALVAAALVGPAGGSRPPILVGLVLLALAVLVAVGMVVRQSLRAADPRDRAALAEGLVIAGTLPALAMFWLVIPAIAAIAVIAGVLGSAPRLRSA